MISSANDLDTHLTGFRTVQTVTTWSSKLIAFSYRKLASVKSSVTRLGDFLHFGQPFKAGGNNYLTQIAHIC